MIKLTLKEDGRPIYINNNLIAVILRDKADDCTTVGLTIDLLYEVVETPAEIMKAPVWLIPPDKV
jgi:hypothetical protein